MAKHDQNSPPPPYSSVDFNTQPPPRPYVEVYDLGPGLKAHAYPHYIPQYSPPVVAPQAAQLHTAPRKQKRCCQSNAQCYGGSASAIILVGLLALAIWLGIRFGTRVATVFYVDDDPYQDNVDPPPQIFDTCPNNTVKCDGIRDCEQGSDETNCVRFVVDNGLQVRTAQASAFRPVCYEGWDQDYADQVCAAMGFKKSYASSPIDSQTSPGLTLMDKSAVPIQGSVNLSSSCPNQQTVSLQCVDCGKQKSTSRIVGGTIAKTGQWPWQLSLHFKGSHVCGGVLISPDFVVTAAHCFLSGMESPADWKVYGGMVSQDNLPQAYLVERILLNSNYNSKTNDQDVAILKLTAPATFNDNVQPACLPMTGQAFPPGYQCWVSGFGTTESGAAAASRDLMEVTVDIIGTTTCNSPAVYRGAITDHMICAGKLEGGKDSCQGDSGGPLVCQAGSRWYLVGITSWGEGCGEKNRPGVYTKVSSVLPWIYSTMQQVTL